MRTHSRVFSLEKNRRAWPHARGACRAFGRGTRIYARTHWEAL
jgi:hypothetical protein